MRKLTSRLATQAALVALIATGAVMLPGFSVVTDAGHAGHAFAKDGDSGDSDSDGDGGNSGEGEGDSDSDSGDSDSDGDDGNSGSGRDGSDDDGNDDSDDDDDEDSVEDEDDNRRGRDRSERSEVTVSLSPDQVQAVLSGQSRLVDNLGRVLELEIETEDGVTKYTAKPHGGDARRNPGPISNVSIVPAVGGSTNDDGTPDQGQGDN